MKTVYYTDELNDEFSTAVIKPRTIDGNYRYDRGCVPSFILYRLIAAPLAALYLFFAHRRRTVGKEKLKKCGDTGYFIYGNHTQDIADAVNPAMINFPRRTSVIVHPNNVSMKLLGRLTPYMGAMPLPDDISAYRNFNAELKRRIEKRNAVCIYPEAHIWPYCTRIRNFSCESFYYPIKFSVPVYCFTNVYMRRKHSKKPRLVTYIDGPFYPDDTLPVGERKKKLRDEVYRQMVARSELNEVKLIEYIKKDDQSAVLR